MIQADITGIPVIRAHSSDITALGAAMAAGMAKGVEIWDIHAEERELVPSDTFLPTSTEEGKLFLYIWVKNEVSVMANIFNSKFCFQKETLGTPNGKWQCKDLWDGYHLGNLQL